MRFRNFSGWTIGGLMAAVLMFVFIIPISAGAPTQVIDPSATPSPNFDLFFPLSKNGVKPLTLQGFDRCTHPTPAQMQVWWDKSPYTVVNLYIGGGLYPVSCQNPPIDSDWVQQVAAQGWKFTATWVGPQAPCSDFRLRMKSDPSKTHLQGKEEAAAAVAAAEALGLLTSENLTIHYDIEGYTATTVSCRVAVDSFLQGWAQELHNQKVKAGAYGSPCRSYIADWVDNTPPLDQIWIAHWTDTTFNPDATVWKVPCGVLDSYWPDEADQRIKQYAGDHVETYDGVRLGIDSNVFDTDPVVVPTATPTPIAEPLTVLDFQLVDSTQGWIRTENSLLWTADNGKTWSDITPEKLTLLSAGFLDHQNGWAAGWLAKNHLLQVAHTDDGGRSWTFSPLDPADTLSGLPLAAVYISTLDPDHLWITVKLQSGSAFSIGRLFASMDGGRTWEARSIPIGEPVEFSNKNEGWTTGGPSGNESYRTEDGGLTWQPATAPQPAFALSEVPLNAVQVSQSDGQTAWLLVQEGFCNGPKGNMSCRQDQNLLWTDDGGRNWQTIRLPQK